MFKEKLIFLVMLFALCESAYPIPQDTSDDSISPPSKSIWLPIINQMSDPKLDGFAMPINDLTIKHVDFIMTLDSGALYLFEPVVLKGKPTYYGGYFRGRGTFYFKPRIQSERFQVERFFKADSVSHDISHVILFFSDSGIIEISTENLFSYDHLLKQEGKLLEYGLKRINYFQDNENAIMLLRNFLHPQSEPLLFVHTINSRFDHDQYIYDPLEREEVKFGKAYPEWDGVEQVCSYNRSVDEDMTNINGPRKDAISPPRYVIKSSIDEKGMLRAEVVLQADVLDSSAQFLTFLIHPEIEIESVETGDGQPVEFLRDNFRSFVSYSLYIMFPEAPAEGSRLELKFRYHGKIADRVYGLFFVDASTIWYPRVSGSRWSNFELHFKSPKGFILIASASFVDSSTVGDTLFTHWRTKQPEKGVTFNIAGFETRSYQEQGLPKVELFHNRPLHEAVLNNYKKDWHKNISTTILNPIKLFSNIYGPPHRDYFRVSEILYSHGESFAGQVNLPFRSFTSKNVWGEDLIIRAHEVAHQWWGSSVGYETYHDQWLSEGLATYSSLRYCNTVVKSEYFVAKLRDFRDNVFATRTGWFGGGQESGPIIQGFRTQSSKTREGFRLIIYEKAALVLHMLRCHLTDWSTLDHSRFNDFLRDFYQRYAGRNASTQDFRNLLEERTGVDWGWFFNQWIYGNELPEYTFRYKIEKDKSDGLWRAYCKVEQRNVGPDFMVIMPVEIEFAKDDKQYAAYVIRGDTTEFTLTFNEKPKKIILNPFEAVLCKVKQ